METLYSILYFVYGILALILFFKVWGMTNNVKKLTKYIVGIVPIGAKVRRTFCDNSAVIYTVINRTVEDGKEYVILQTNDPTMTQKIYKATVKDVAYGNNGLCML